MLEYEPNAFFVTKMINKILQEYIIPIRGTKYGSELYPNFIGNYLDYVWYFYIFEPSNWLLITDLWYFNRLKKAISKGFTIFYKKKMLWNLCMLWLFCIFPEALYETWLKNIKQFTKDLHIWNAGKFWLKINRDHNINVRSILK